LQRGLPLERGELLEREDYPSDLFTLNMLILLIKMVFDRISIYHDRAIAASGEIYT
jgi:hypothetical protein